MHHRPSDAPLAIDKTMREQADYAPRPWKDEFPPIVTLLPAEALLEKHTQNPYNANIPTGELVDFIRGEQVDQNTDSCADVLGNVSETILDEAARITSCDRNKTYGPPRDNHSRTAALWQAYLSGIGPRKLDYRDVCWLNVLQKASRDVFCRGRDSLVDAVGYLRNVEMAENDEGR
jgi:hypothetical protein